MMRRLSNLRASFPAEIASFAAKTGDIHAGETPLPCPPFSPSESRPTPRKRRKRNKLFFIVSACFSSKRLYCIGCETCRNEQRKTSPDAGTEKPNINTTYF